ncbi:hypothetical protein [Virgisporangium ochraceum]|uniref:hypothetical protein n=1 Tax=Virgisporangium ochraceum TaxID=65505 RepID=UPI0019412111|nr:hypothetical protein [Virgisporangium ochraceum]
MRRRAEGSAGARSAAAPASHRQDLLTGRQLTALPLAARAPHGTEVECPRVRPAEVCTVARRA